MVLGTPTIIPVAVLKRQLVLAIKASEARILSDVIERHDKSNHAGKKEIEFEVVTGYPTGMPYRKYEEGEQRPNNGRNAFILQVKEEHEPRLRAVMEEMKATGGLKKFCGPTSWTIEMQPPTRENDDLQAKGKMEKSH